MDRTDLKILGILHKQSNTPLRKIGIMTGLNSPSAVSRRIEAMKRNTKLETIVQDSR